MGRRILKNRKKTFGIIGSIVVVLVLAVIGGIIISNRGHEYTGEWYEADDGAMISNYGLSDDGKHAISTIVLMQDQYWTRTVIDINTTTKSDMIYGKSGRYMVTLFYKDTDKFNANEPYKYSYGKDTSKGINDQITKDSDSISVSSGKYSMEYDLASKSHKFMDVKAYVRSAKKSGAYKMPDNK